MAELLLAGTTSGAHERLAASIGRAMPLWSVRQVTGADGLLQEVTQRKNHYDLVLAGFEQPEAFEPVFDACRTASPQTLRFAAFDAVLPAQVPFAHQVLAIPERIEAIHPVLAAGVEVAERACAHPTLARIVANLHDVPSPPVLYFDVREQVEQRHGDLAGMADVASRDPSLVARILRVANSGFYGLPRSISNLSEAVGLIGTDALLGMVLAAQLYSGLPPPGLNLEVLWQHTLQVSSLAKQIAALEGADRTAQGEAAIAGLLHDLGIMVLLENEPAQYQPMWHKAAGDESRLAELEREAFGTTHGELGALILKLWSLPEAVIDAVAHSHTVDHIDAPGLSVQARAVLAAEWLLASSGADVPEPLESVDQGVLASWQGECERVLSSGLSL